MHCFCLLLASVCRAHCTSCVLIPWVLIILLTKNQTGNAFKWHFFAFALCFVSHYSLGHIYFLIISDFRQCCHTCNFFVVVDELLLHPQCISRGLQPSRQNYLGDLGSIPLHTINSSYEVIKLWNYSHSVPSGPTAIGALWHFGHPSTLLPFYLIHLPREPLAGTYQLPLHAADLSTTFWGNFFCRQMLPLLFDRVISCSTYSLSWSK